MPSSCNKKVKVMKNMYPNTTGLIQYQIQPYDTLWMLAQRFNTTVNTILALNQGIDSRYLRVGQLIYIRTGYRIHNETMNHCPASPGISKNEMDLINHMRMLWEEVFQRHELTLKYNLCIERGIRLVPIEA